MGRKVADLSADWGRQHRPTVSPNFLDLHGRVSRRELVLDPRVWMTFSLVYATVAVSACGIWVLWPAQFSAARVLPFAVLLIAIAVAAFVTQPPRMGDIRNHLIIASIPVVTAIGMWVYQPKSAIPLAALMFMGTFGPSRVERRREVLAHFAFATVVIVGTLALLGFTLNTTLAVASVLPALWVLGLTAVLILEAVEQQSDELAWLVRRDPLTGVGNRRLLAETLVHEAARHHRSGHQFTVLAMDLNGFKAVNDRLGHQAGDELLRSIAAALQRTVRAQDTVVRQGGDEFCILLPETTAEQAATVRALLSRALSGVSVGGMTVSSGFGSATWPVDGADETALLTLADARLASDKVADRLAAFTSGAPADEAPDVDPNQFAEHAPTSSGISRSEIAVNRTVWIATGAMVGIYAVAVALVAVFGGPDVASALPLLAVALGVVAAIALMTEPPRLSSWRNHLIIAIPYVGSAAFIFAAPEFAAVAMGSLAFSGALAAVRLVSRWQIAVHIALSSAVIMGFALTGYVELEVGIALALIVVVICGIGIGDVVYLEAAEAQAQELERLVRRDPLTGLGNRRLLDERLDYELRRHQRSRRELAIVTLDLNGFKALNDDLGHAAGDDVLRKVAELMRERAGDADCAVRQGGDEFCLVLPETSRAQALEVASELQRAVSRAGSQNYPISTGVGVAVFPHNGGGAYDLLLAADRSLRRDKERVPPHLQRRAPRTAMRPASD